MRWEKRSAQNGLKLRVTYGSENRVNSEGEVASDFKKFDFGAHKNSFPWANFLCAQMKDLIERSILTKFETNLTRSSVCQNVAERLRVTRGNDEQPDAAIHDSQACDRISREEMKCAQARPVPRRVM